jgi:hypothetical protein
VVPTGSPLKYNTPPTLYKVLVVVEVVEFCKVKPLLIVKLFTVVVAVVVPVAKVAR